MSLLMRVLGAIGRFLSRIKDGIYLRWHGWGNTERWPDLWVDGSGKGLYSLEEAVQEQRSRH